MLCHTFYSVFEKCLSCWFLILTWFWMSSNNFSCHWNQSAVLMKKLFSEHFYFIFEACCCLYDFFYFCLQEKNNWWFKREMTVLFDLFYQFSYIFTAECCLMNIILKLQYFDSAYNFFYAYLLLWFSCHDFHVFLILQTVLFIFDIHQEQK